MYPYIHTSDSATLQWNISPLHIDPMYSVLASMRKKERERVSVKEIHLRFGERLHSEIDWLVFAADHSYFDSLNELLHILVAIISQ